MKIRVIIPAYNEAKRISNVISGIKHVLRDKDYQIIVVDDGSTDNTSYVALQMKCDVVLRKVFNRGKGSSIRMAFYNLKFWSIEEYDIIITMDADGQHDPSDIPLLIDALNEYDVVVGNRNKKKYPAIKKFGNMFLSLSLSLLTWKKILDGECGFKAFRWYVVKKILPYLKEDRYGFDGEFLILASKFGFDIGFVNIKSKYIKNKGTNVMTGIRNFISYLRCWYGCTFHRTAR